MMKKYYQLIIIGLLIISCSDSNTKKTKSLTTKSNNLTTEKDLNIEASFQEFLDFIPSIELPIKTDCSVHGGISHFEIPKRYHKWLLTNEGVYGKLKVNSDFHVIIHTVTSDEILPFIFTYDTLGNKIDSLLLNQGYCGAEETFDSNTSYTITEYLTIIQKDSISAYTYIDSGAHYKRTLDSIFIDVYASEINDDGTINHPFKVTQYNPKQVNNRFQKYLQSLIHLTSPVDSSNFRVTQIDTCYVPSNHYSDFEKENKEDYLKEFQPFIDSSLINQSQIIYSKPDTIELCNYRYLGELKTNDMGNYHVVTVFKVFTPAYMSPKGNSKIAFIKDDKSDIIVYDIDMPYILPIRIENNFLIFEHNRNQIRYLVPNGLPDRFCPPTFGCQ